MSVMAFDIDEVDSGRVFKLNSKDEEWLNG